MSLEEVEARIAAVEGGRVLDVATGGGEFLRAVEEFASRELVIATDVLARAAAPVLKGFAHLAVRFAAADADRLPFRDGFFDTVCFSNSLHHMAEPRRTCDELLRVLRPGGLMMLNEMYADAELPAQLSHVLAHAWAAKVDTLAGRIHRPTYLKGELAAFVAALPLAALEVYDYFWPIENPHCDEIVAPWADGVKKHLERLRLEAAAADLIAEGGALLLRLEEVGLAPAPAVFAVGRKPRQ